MEHPRRRRLPKQAAQRQQVIETGARRRRFAGIGALAAGTLGVGLASAVGVGELAFGAIAAYAAYRVIRYRVTPAEALMEGVELEHGEVPRRHSKSA